MANHRLANEISRHLVEELNKTLKPSLHLAGTGSKDHEYLLTARHSICDFTTNTVYTVTVGHNVQIAIRGEGAFPICRFGLEDPNMLDRLQTALQDHILAHRTPLWTPLVPTTPKSPGP